MYHTDGQTVSNLHNGTQQKTNEGATAHPFDGGNEKRECDDRSE